MRYFREIGDSDPALIYSPMIRAIGHIFSYLAENGPIGLTKSGAFKRVFVEWAAEHFDWPGYRPADLYAVNKVLNEPDFYPLSELHDVLLAAKLGRHFKGEFRLTAAGKSLVGRPGALFDVMAPFYLLRMDHARYARRDREPVLNSWDIYLNIINVEADGGATGEHLRQVLFGPPEPSPHYDELMGSLHGQVLRPLCWLGLLQKVGDERSWKKDSFAKTPLWRAAMHLDTDHYLSPVVTH